MSEEPLPQRRQRQSHNGNEGQMIVIMRGNVIIEEESIQKIRAPQPVEEDPQAPVLHQEDTQQSQHNEKSTGGHARFYFPLKIVVGIQQQRRDEASLELG